MITHKPRVLREGDQVYFADPLIGEKAKQPMLDYWELRAYLHVLGWIWKRILKWWDKKGWRSRAFNAIANRYWEIGDCYVDGTLFEHGVQEPESLVTTGTDQGAIDSNSGKTTTTGTSNTTFVFPPLTINPSGDV